MLTSRLGVSNVIVPLVIDGPLKLTLFVVNRPYGLDRYQTPFPQSNSPVGYCPVSAWSCPARSSNVIVCVPPGVAVAVGGTVGVALAVGVLAGVVVAVGGAGVLVAVGPPGVGV